MEVELEEVITKEELLEDPAAAHQILEEAKVMEFQVKEIQEVDSQVVVAEAQAAQVLEVVVTEVRSLVEQVLFGQLQTPYMLVAEATAWEEMADQEVAEKETDLLVFLVQ
jgi:hypothetical protein